ncbi:acyl-homoserine-lactone synthase [Maritimibacter sp. UBA3975]|uniref:acyl-homoserine-lactone synthase n=1 Tax=Maritimibacter sp. UBA3975 TaxID=1946833 RepID=UPI000C094B62|nr:acyl-homoserine-lactone synthase [Maritimibacter sp. UBA3975]MAM62750.1 autoinducer synthase [Maritimibacter sp.]|tara:strand:+ start:20041 stop:20682 length:642 start_codon:yes stop_codon:yes gene_type:complete
MLRYLYASDLARFPRLARSMFTDRAEQFSRRLGWDVTVNAAGEERDQYDALNPLYVIWEGPDGAHGGSMRFLPTTGRTMVNEHFDFLNDGAPITSPFIWECTRFCLSPGADRRVAPALALGAGELMARFGLEHFVGVFDARMERIYRLMGLEPEVLGRSGEGRDAIGVGLWSMDAAAFAPTLAKVGVSRETSQGWLRYSLALGGAAPELAQAV